MLMVVRSPTHVESAVEVICSFDIIVLLIFLGPVLYLLVFGLVFALCDMLTQCPIRKMDNEPCI